MIVSSVRKVGTRAGKILDAEDRKLLGQGLVIALVFAFAVLTVAGSAGLAFRLFEVMRG